MEVTEPVDGSRATASPCGIFIACIWNLKLRICPTNAPEQYTDINIRPTKTVDELQWSEDSSRVAIKSEKTIEIVVLADLSYRVRIDNGSSGLGDLGSFDFVGPDHLLVRWEFGKAKLWNLNDGKGADLQDLKTTCAFTCRVRPRKTGALNQTLATLSRPASEDVLNIYLPALSKHISSTKLPTIDAKRIIWSPDGRWLAVLDTPTAAKSVHILTPDGHLFRTCPTSSDVDTASLGARGVVWSPNSQILALTGYDGRITLLNARTFSPVAIIEHSTTIDQRSLPQEQQAPMWQEHVAASGERSFNRMTPPLTPPLSKIPPDPEPEDLGVSVAEFSCDGTYLATNDERMRSTIWIWNMSTLAAHAVLVMHSYGGPEWHPTRPSLLKLGGAGRFTHLFDAAIPSRPPVSLPISTFGGVSLRWVHPTARSSSAMLLSCRMNPKTLSFRVLYPQGFPDGDAADANGDMPNGDHEPFDEGRSEDSLFDVLSGRKPLPPKTEPSYTEMVDLEVETEEENASVRVDDTFREKKSRRRVVRVDDPFDDSEIF